MLYTEQSVQDNLRNREGRRVFYLGEHDRLTPGARDFLQRQRIEILPAAQARPSEYRLCNGAVLSQKPEHMTHLAGNTLVSKTHPRIAFRGAIDTLEAELLLCQLENTLQRKELGEILALARRLIRCDVLDEPLPEERLCGLTQDELHHRSHFPQDYYNQPHFMPMCTDGAAILQLNRCRCAARSAELAGAHAFTDADGNMTRPDILQALNRMSSMLYILMIQRKAAN